MHREIATSLTREYASLAPRNDTVSMYKVNEQLSDIVQVQYNIYKALLICIAILTQIILHCKL